MQIQRTTNHNLSDDLRYTIASNLLEPQETTKISQICTEWKKELDSKLFWKETAQKISQTLLVPEHTIVPEDKEDTLTVEAYKEHIRRNASFVKNEIETILLTIFPSVQLPKDNSILHDAYFTPYAEHIKKKMDSVSDDQYAEFEAFMNGERLYPTIFKVFIDQLNLEMISRGIYVEMFRKLINNGENQKILDWLETASLCKNLNSSSAEINMFEAFYSITFWVSATYMNDICIDSPLKQKNVIKNDIACTNISQFLEREIKDPLFFKKLCTHLPFQGPSNPSKELKEEMINEITGLLEKHKSQKS